MLLIRIILVPIIRENAKRDLRESARSGVRASGPRDPIFEKACDAVLAETAKGMEPFFSGYAKDGTYSVFRVDVANKRTWRFECRRVDGRATIVSSTIVTSDGPA